MSKRIDANQVAIVAALRQVGATVQILSAVGKGCPDLAVGHRGTNYLFEIKDGDKVRSKRKLTPDEQAWHDEWRGQVCVVESVEDALSQIGVL